MRLDDGAAGPPTSCGARAPSRRSGSRIGAVDRLHLRRLLHADPHAGRRGRQRCGFGPWEMVLGAVLRLRHLRQRRLPARAGLQVHVPVRALPERDVRQGHADHQPTTPSAASRAARARRKADPAQLGLGDCIDCSLCVQVCPTGIDIRNGLQYECIGCAACIDVCDDVMDKMGYPQGLIRYATQNGLAQHLTPRRSGCAASSGRGCWSTPRSWCVIVLALLRQPGAAPSVQGRRGARPRVAGAAGRRRPDRERLPPADHERHRAAAALPHRRATACPASRWTAPADRRWRPAEARWVTLNVRVPPEAASQAGPGAHAIHFQIELLGADAGGQADAPALRE